MLSEKAFLFLAILFAFEFGGFCVAFPSSEGKAIVRSDADLLSPNTITADASGPLVPDDVSHGDGGVGEENIVNLSTQDEGISPDVDVAEDQQEDFAPRDENRKLLLVIELCRHGDRTPLAEYPNDVLPASKWPEGVGELTAIGQRAHFNLGKRLRRRYVDTGFLNPSFNVRDVYIRSTTIDRTLMSAYSQMAGLFPEDSAAVYDVGVQFGRDVLTSNQTGLPHRWQPVPIHSESIQTDGLLLPGNDCPRYRQISEERRRTSEWLDRQAAEKQLLEAVAKIVGVQTLDLGGIWNVHDTWTCDEAHGVPLPPGVTGSIRAAVRNLSDWILVFGNSGIESHRLAAGLLLYEIKTRLELTVQSIVDPEKTSKSGNLPKKFVLYSAHDSTLAATLAALGADLTTNPPYNSTIIWELSRDLGSGQFYVQIEYNGKVEILKGCSRKGLTDPSCTIHEYMQATRRVTVPGSLARERECLVGLQRTLSVFTSWLPGTPKDILDGGTEQPVALSWSSSSSNIFGYILLILVGCIFGAAFMKAKTSFDGYYLTRTDEHESATAANLRPFLRRSEPRILL